MPNISAEKQKQYTKTRNQKSKAIIHKLKFNGCAICGYCICDRSLDFHHVNPEDKKFALNVAHICQADKKIITEVNKCILLCKNCHGEIEEKNKK